LEWEQEPGTLIQGSYEESPGNWRSCQESRLRGPVACRVCESFRIFSGSFGIQALEMQVARLDMLVLLNAAQWENRRSGKSKDAAKVKRGP
jgi:hypothetical protein